MLGSRDTSGLIDLSLSRLGQPGTDDSIALTPLHVYDVEDALAEGGPNDDQHAGAGAIVQIDREVTFDHRRNRST